MISVIMLLGQKQRHWTFWLLRGVTYIVTMTASGALVGALAGGGGMLLRTLVPFPVLLGAVALLALAYALHEWGVLRLPHPERAWQVPNAWAVRRPILGAAAFGVVIGTGFLTYIPFTSYYLVLGWEILLGQPLAGALVGAAYGLARALPVILGARVTLQGGQMADLHLGIMQAGPRLHRLAGLVLLITAAAAGLPLFLGR